MKSRTSGPLLWLAVAASTAFFAYRTYRNGMGWFVSAIAVVIVLLLALAAWMWQASRRLPPPGARSQRYLDGAFVSDFRGEGTQTFIKVRLIFKSDVMKVVGLDSPEPVVKWEAPRKDVEFFRTTVAPMPDAQGARECVHFGIYGRHWVFLVTADHVGSTQAGNEMQVERIVHELEAWRVGTPVGTVESGGQS